MEKGKLNWVFCDGDLPQKDGTSVEAHESLMILNINDTDAEIDMTFLFEDKEPIEGVKFTVKAKRVRCIRMDRELGDGEKKIFLSPGQYALVFNSSVPVFAVFGRLDTTQSNMAFYTVQGHTY